MADSASRQPHLASAREDGAEGEPGERRLLAARELLLVVVASAS
jgi:hypothetical protein